MVKKTKEDSRKIFLCKLYLTLLFVVLASVGLSVYVYLEIKQTLGVVVVFEQISSNDKQAMDDWKKLHLPREIVEYLKQGKPVSELIGSHFSERLYLIFETPRIPRSQNAIQAFAYVKKREGRCFLSLYGADGPLQYESTSARMIEFSRWVARFTGSRDTLVAKSVCGDTTELFQWWGKRFSRVPLLSVDNHCFIDFEGTCGERRNFTYSGLDSRGKKIVCDERFKNSEYIICK